jgi:hypothetical protein
VPSQNVRNRRTRLISTRVTEHDYSRLAKIAEASGASVSEYARRQIVDGLTLRPDTRFLGAELLAFQEVFLALILASLKGDRLNENRIAELRVRFAGVKSALVDQALEQFQSTASRAV